MNEIMRLKITNDYSEWLIYCINNYEHKKILELSLKAGVDLKKYFKENPEKLIKLCEVFNDKENELQKILNIIKDVKYQFNPDDIMGYLDSDFQFTNKYFIKIGFLNYILNNGTDLNFIQSKDGTTLIENIVKNILQNKNSIIFTNLESKILEQKIKDKEWDISIFDINGKNSIDYLKDLLSNDSFLNSREIVEKYKTSLLYSQKQKIKNKNEFIKQVSELKENNILLLSNIIPYLFLYGDFLEKEDLNMGFESGRYLKDLIDYMVTYNNNKIFNKRYLLKMIERVSLSPINQDLFFDQNNFEDNLNKIIKLIRTDISGFSSYADFAYLYANKKNVKNKQKYLSLVPELLNRIFTDIEIEDNVKIFHNIMDFFSYDVVFSENYLSMDIKESLKKIDNKICTKMYMDYVMLEEKYKLTKLITTEKNPIRRNRI